MGEDVNEHKPINDYGRKVGWNFFSVREGVRILESEFF